MADNFSINESQAVDVPESWSEIEDETEKQPTFNCPGCEKRDMDSILKCVYTEMNILQN
jgi:hypothetical protein